MEAVPQTWTTIRMPYVASVVSRGYQEEFDLLSVYLNRGVIPYSEGGGLVHKPSEDLSKYQYVVPGDIVLNNQQAWRGSVGVSTHHGNVSPAYIVMRPTSNWNSEYLNYLLRSPFIVTQLEAASRGVGDIQRQLSRPWMREILFPSPPIDEQRRISDFLDRETAKIDTLIAKQEQLITTLDERRGAVISRAVTRGLVEDRPSRDSGVEWLGKIPADWGCKPIRSLMKFNTEKNTGYKSRNYLSLMANVGVIPYEEKGSVGNKSPEDLEKCKVVRIGDFVLNSMNFGIGSFGVSPYEGVCSTVYVVMTPKSEICAPSFLKHIFSMKAFQKHAQSLGYGILEHRAAIGWHDLKNIGFPVPPLPEQHEIANYLDHESSRIDQLRAEAKKMMAILAERRQALISAAVTGKLEVGV